MKSADELKTIISSLFRNQLFAVLSTQGDKGPHVVIVCFLESLGLRELVFVTSKKTRKYNNIAIHPLVSLYIDNRSNTLYDLENLTGVQILGRAEVASSEDRNYFRSRFIEKFPDLNKFYDDPLSSVIKVTVSRYEVIDDFHNVTSVDMI